MTPKEQATPYPVRMPEDLRARLTEAAEQGNRSLHAEIIARLQASFEAPAQPQSMREIANRLFEMQQAIEDLTGKQSSLLLEAVRKGEVVYVDGKLVAGKSITPLAEEDGIVPLSPGRRRAGGSAAASPQAQPVETPAPSHYSFEAVAGRLAAKRKRPAKKKP